MMFVVHPQGLSSTSSKKHSDEHAESKIETWWVTLYLLYLVLVCHILRNIQPMYITIKY